MNISGCLIGTHLVRIAEHRNSALIADAADEHWHAIHKALSPIIGIQGVVSLYRRSVFLARVRYNWLREPDSSEVLSQPLDSLRAALVPQSSDDAVAAQLALLQIFNDLLEHLIGTSLTDRLLDPVWQDAQSPRDGDHHTQGVTEDKKS